MLTAESAALGLARWPDTRAIMVERWPSRCRLPICTYDAHPCGVRVDGPDGTKTITHRLGVYVTAVVQAALCMTTFHESAPFVPQCPLWSLWMQTFSRPRKVVFVALQTSARAGSVRTW